MITQQDFRDWKANPVSRAFFLAAQERIEECKDLLSYSAGSDSNQDRLLVGLITAYREMQEFRVEDTEEVVE
jgi:hypothetical protein